MKFIQKEKFLNYIHYVALLILGVGLFLFSIRNIAKLSNLFAWDELGYWGSAAYIAGFDWSDIVSQYAAYYSYGYSLLIAAILLLFGKIGIAYEVAIIFNGIFLLGSFYLAYYVGIKIFGAKYRYLILLGACISTFYANNIMQSNMAWTENCLYFLYWVIIALFASIREKVSTLKMILIAFFSVYIFVVHNRMAAILIASIVTVILMKYYKNVTTKQFCSFLLCIIGCFLLSYFFRIQIKENVWVETGNKVLANTMASIGKDTLGKFNVYGLIEMFKTLCCRFFYWGCTTYLTFFVLLKKLLCFLFDNFKEKNLDCFFFFLLISMLGVFAIMVLTLSQAGSYQALLYGRYQDTIIGPFLLFGFLFYIIEEDGRMSHLLLIIIVFQAILGLLMLIVQGVEIKNSYYVANCNVNFSQYWQGSENGYDLSRAFYTSVLVFYGLTCIKYIYTKKKKLAELLLMLGTFIFVYQQIVVSDSVFETHFTNYENSENIIQESLKICDDELPIYFYDDGKNWRNQPLAMWIQYEYYDRKIHLIIDLENADEGYIFIPNIENEDKEIIPEIEYDGELLLKEGYLTLYEVID